MVSYFSAIKHYLAIKKLNYTMKNKEKILAENTEKKINKTIGCGQRSQSGPKYNSRKNIE